MEQQTSQFSTPPKRVSQIFPVIIAIILTTVIIGGGMFWWANKKQTELNNEISSLRTQVDQLKQISITSTPLTGSNNQSDELVKTKFELAILNFWQVRQVFQDPQNKNRFYYVTNFGDGSDIWVYDLAKDKTYQSSGNFNIPGGSTLLLSQKLTQYQEFRGIGITDSKFVFTETGSDNSPGSCFSPWFYPNLSYIDLGISKPTRKPFTLPQDLKASEEQKVVDCQKTL